MSKKIKVLAMLLGLIMTLSLVGCGENSGTSASTELKAEDEAPEFYADLTNGKSFTLSENKGKVVLINFWATWCGPCVEEMPGIEKLQKEYGDKIEIVSVNYGEDKKTVDEFLKDKNYTFKVAYDESMDICNLYPSDGIPYLVVVDKEGKVHETMVGSAGADEQYKRVLRSLTEAYEK